MACDMACDIARVFHAISLAFRMGILAISIRYRTGYTEKRKHNQAYYYRANARPAAGATAGSVGRVRRQSCLIRYLHFFKQLIACQVRLDYRGRGAWNTSQSMVARKLAEPNGVSGRDVLVIEGNAGNSSANKSGKLAVAQVLHKFIDGAQRHNSPW